MRGSLRIICATALLALAAGCASPRYVGSIGRSKVYSNRGFGVLVDLTKGGVLDRWQALDPGDLSKVPMDRRPRRVREPLDLDGDGFLQVTEATVFYDPTLRLISKTSSVAQMDLEVQILSVNHPDAPLDGLIGIELKTLAGSSTTARAEAFGSIAKRTLTGDIDARVAEVTTRIDGPRRQIRRLIAYVPDFVTEEGQRRRHIVRLTLTTTSLDDQARADFDALASGMLLAPKGGEPGTKERW